MYVCVSSPWNEWAIALGVDEAAMYTIRIIYTCTCMPSASHMYVHVHVHVHVHFLAFAATQLCMSLFSLFIANEVTLN